MRGLTNQSCLKVEPPKNACPLTNLHQQLMTMIIFLSLTPTPRTQPPHHSTPGSSQWASDTSAAAAAVYCPHGINPTHQHTHRRHTPDSLRWVTPQHRRRACCSWRSC